MSDLAPTPGEAHGILCGLICGAAADPERAWLDQLLPAPPAGPAGAPNAGVPNVGVPSPEVEPPATAAEAAALRASLEALARATGEGLKGSDFGFVLLLPDDERPLGERAAALCDWVRGFLYAMGLLGLTEPDLAAETREVLRDFTNITRMDVEALSDDEESEAALTEVAEYVRVAALLVREERAAALGGAR